MWTRLPKRRVLQLINLYPPYVGAGVRVVGVEGDVDALTVELRYRPWNRNYVGTAFGGSLYSMADPWFMLLLMWRLGPGFVVWDKAASIDFLRPGRGPVRGRFEVTAARPEEIRAQVEREGKVEPVFEVELRQGDTLVARVTKRLSVRAQKGTGEATRSSRPVSG